MEHQQDAGKKDSSGNETLYDVLEVKMDASMDDIRQKYLLMAKKYHPDKSKGEYDKFMMVQKAWEILRDEGARAKYNQSILADVTKNIAFSTIYEIDLDDCEYDEMREEYNAHCRCGEEIVVHCDDLEEVCLNISLCLIYFMIYQNSPQYLGH